MGGGGGSSSSSSQQKTSNQNFDNRIATTDNGIVVKDAYGTSIDKSSRYFNQDITSTDARQYTDSRTFSTVTELDNGAISDAFSFADNISEGALSLVSDFRNSLVNVSENATSAVNSTANRAFDFVKSQNETVGQDVIKTLTPWLIGAVVAIVIFQGARVR